jgi:hypothetical protein
MGDVEYRCVGRTQSGITISTCRDLKLEESPIEARFEDGKLERLGWRLDSTVEEREELSPTEVQGLSGATERSQSGTTMGTCFDRDRCDEAQLPTGDDESDRLCVLAEWVQR